MVLGVLRRDTVALSFSWFYYPTSNVDLLLGRNAGKVVRSATSAAFDWLKSIVYSNSTRTLPAALTKIFPAN